ncbi:carboxymuconolactone decarboxylase family protein [Microbulbifer sp. ARAS458-1]|uniref:carboxymuconolactone decarboxylase family protein n=1 Tax=Microbulbifer sp. ARAS458-1 TaxID=3140242 RepID=UPI003878197F
MSTELDLSQKHKEDTAFDSGWSFLSSLIPNLHERIEKTIPSNPDLEKLSIEFVYGNLHSRPYLSTRDREIIAISITTALGAEHALRAHIELGYRCGLTREDILEIILHSAAYSGFPRALSASKNAIEILEEINET